MKAARHLMFGIAATSVLLFGATACNGDSADAPGANSGGTTSDTSYTPVPGTETVPETDPPYETDPGLTDEPPYETDPGPTEEPPSGTNPCAFAGDPLCPHAPITVPAPQLSPPY